MFVTVKQLKVIIFFPLAPIFSLACGVPQKLPDSPLQP